MKTIPFEQYIKKVKGCYLGKAVGGTLGMPYEGKTQTFSLTYYDPVPETMLPNDDIDLQVVYLEEIYRHGLPVNRFHLSEAWKCLQSGPDEYGIAKYHLRKGLRPPASGAYENAFYRGMGAAIRSEIWACMAPGDPALAVSFAREDACIDHCEAGIDAAVFLTALESAAFTESDRDRLLDIAFSFIPEDGDLSRALHNVLIWWAQTPDPITVREKIVEKYAVVNWTDIITNLCFILLGWLHGGDDFGKAICTTVNCGFDTDCTGATLGALLGIIDSDLIGKEWLSPIGDALVLSNNIAGAHNTDSIESFSMQIAGLASRSLEYYQSEIQLEGICEQAKRLAEDIPIRNARYEQVGLHLTPRDSLIAVSPLTVTLRYPEGFGITAGIKGSYSLFVSNPLEKTVECSLSLSTPLGKIISPDNFSFTLSAGESTELSFCISPREYKSSACDPLDINLCVDGLPIYLSAPILMSIPWRNLTTGKPDPAEGFIKKIPSGKQRYAVDFKAPNNMKCAVACVCTRDIRLFINGELIKEGSTASAVPSVHRGSATVVSLPRGINRVIVEISDGEAGELFFSVGELDSWIWYNNIDWSLPCQTEQL